MKKNTETLRVLVTGGAGYIGSVLVPKLLHLGHQVTVVDSFLYNQTPLLDLCHLENLNIVREDVRNVDDWKTHLKSADVIVPLACLTGAPICKRDPQTATTVNRDAVLDLAKRKSKDQMLIFPNTNSGYGVGEDGIHCDETSALNPVSLYGKLKVETERALLDQGDCVTFRFATVFGPSPRMRLDLLVNDFAYRAMHDRFIVLFESHFKRNYLHIQDAAQAFLHVIEHYDQMQGQAYNVGLSDANLSKRELCELLQRMIPEFQFFESEIGTDPDQRNYIVSNKKIEATGYTAQHSLQEGIEQLRKAFSIIHRSQFANA